MTVGHCGTLRGSTCELIAEDTSAFGCLFIYLFIFAAMSLIRSLWECALSPRLFKLHENTWKTYEPNSFERWSDYVVTSFAAIWSISLHILPFIATLMYRRGNSLAENAITISKFFAGAGAIVIASLAVRGYARVSNRTYLKFIKTLNKAKQAYNVESKTDLLKYDFEFWAWPTDFRVGSLERSDGRGRIMMQSRTNNISRRGDEDLIFAVPCEIISYVVANTIAIKLMYPGSMSLVNMAMKSAMLQGRMDLLGIGGERSKLITHNNIEIDTMFVDRRQKRSPNGHILVITCEGNCGFYEVGLMSTPLGKGYSVLGWNHPGFGGSTGSPFPDAEIDSIDAVMRFAIEKLQFPEEQIIVYGWSIGGFTATWAAMNYPRIHGLVLDATFDDVLPLAMARMPKIIDSIVRNVIRRYLNLYVAEQLKRYDGPVLLVRRTDDEIMCTPSNNISDNRANTLLIRLLTHRYPKLFSDCRECSEILTQYLSSPHDASGNLATSLASRTARLFSNNHPLDETMCAEIIKQNLKDKDNSISYPSNLGENCDLTMKQHLVIYLANKYMVDQSSQHCTPLITELFHSGWTPRSLLELKHT